MPDSARPLMPHSVRPQPPAAASLRVRLGHASLCGPRPRNEDFVGAAMPDGAERDGKGIVLAVADGLGGHADGREAAEYAVRALLADYYATPDTWPVAKAIDAVLEATNRWLVAQARRARESAGMATTLTAVVLRGARYHLAHVGDTRAYLLRGGQLVRLTEDHTWEHPELDNVLKRAVGLDTRLAVDYGDGELRAGDRFVLLSDGVWGRLGDEGIAAMLARHTDPQAAADALATGAIDKGSVDNATALVADVDAVPDAGLRDSLDRARRLPLPPRLRPGERIDGLRVLEVLHESRVTLLYRMAREADGTQLVLKTLHADAADEAAAAALAHEEWLARRVPAPRFPQVVRHDERAHLYYLMTWHEGETLKARLGRGHRFAPHEVAELGVELLRGLAVLHRLAIVHRDIKPDNLHLDREGKLRLLDLGVAAAEAGEGHERLGEINNPGTPSYMAPELYAGARASESSDLYACGVTLYELLTRRYPYGEIEPFQTPRFGDPVPPTRYRPDTPDWLETILQKACAADPTERFETAEEFLLALERGAHRPLATRRPTPLLKRDPVRVFQVLAVASLLLNLFLLYLLFGR